MRKIFPFRLTLSQTMKMGASVGIASKQDANYRDKGGERGWSSRLQAGDPVSDVRRGLLKGALAILAAGSRALAAPG